MQNGSGRVKQVALPEGEPFPAGTRLTKPILPPKTVAAWDDGMKELVSNIERKLPNVADAGLDLQALRALFNLQLQVATTLRLGFPLTYLNGETYGQPTRLTPFPFDGGGTTMETAPAVAGAFP
jgi:hypothetical protein